MGEVLKKLVEFLEAVLGMVHYVYVNVTMIVMYLDLKFRKHS